MPFKAKSIADRSHDFLSSRPNSLETFFSPKDVALVGASDKAGSVGRALLENLLKSPGLNVYAVNPGHSSLLGVKSYPHVGDIGHAPSLAVIATPASTVPGLLRECAQAGIKSAIVISAGFRELGPGGEALERRAMAEAASAGMRILGPNCLGLMSPHSGLNASFAAPALPGKVALLSQSGALITAVLDWGRKKNLGFSRVVSLGSMMDLGWADMIDYLGNDPKTQSILIYMESIGNARAFLSAAREVAISKPIILIKAGRSEGAAKAAASHTGSLSGSNAALEAAFRRCGILSVDTISELFYLAETLSMQPKPRGPRLCVLTNAGGPGVLAADALISGQGRLSALSAPELEALSAFLPAAWSHANPVDILGDADPIRFAKALEVLAADPGNDGVLVVLTPQAMTDPSESARLIAALPRPTDRPIFASWMGGAQVEAGRGLLAKAGIPSFPFPDMACKIFNQLWRHSENLAALYETPDFFEDGYQADRQGVTEKLDAARQAGRTLLTELESKEILKSYGIPVVETLFAADAAQAAALASHLGFPVALKLHSLTLTHKAEVGGVKLGLLNEAQVRAAFDAVRNSVAKLKGLEHFQGVVLQPMAAPGGHELILGSSFDSQLGPVLLFGSGGSRVELFQDSALGLPPLNSTLARRLMEPTKAYAALQNPRFGALCDLPALERLLVKFSRLVSEQPLIKEMDINPLLVSAQGMAALDARVILHDPALPLESIPKPAIRPYPGQYACSWNSLLIRPIRPEDEALLVEFHAALSAQSVYQRYFQDLKFSARTAHERLLRVCFGDYESEIALLAEGGLPGGKKEAVGIARLSRLRHGEEAEFSMLLRDAWQQKGLGSRLMEQMLEVAQEEGITRVLAYALPQNLGMRRILEKFGFKESAGPEGGPWELLVHSSRRKP